MEELGWRGIPDDFDINIVFPDYRLLTVEDFFETLLFNAAKKNSFHVQKTVFFFRTFCVELSEGQIGNAAVLKSRFEINYLHNYQRRPN